MEKNPILHNDVKIPFEDWPDLQAQYYEGLDILDVHTGDTKGESEAITHGTYLFRNKEGEVSGFCLMDASRVLEPFLDSLRKRSKLTFDDYPTETVGDRNTGGQSEL